jgi:hypothetical protein
MNRPWTPQERSALASRYPTEGSLPLAAALERSPDSITSQARRYGLSSPGARMRQAKTRVWQSRSVNVEFFAGQTAAVAFVLGLVWACGTVKTKHRQVLRLALPSDRVGSLRRVKELMESRHSIQTYEDGVVLEISNSDLVHTLLTRQGPPPKSATNPQAPRIPEHLIAKFAAGHLAATSRRTGNHIHWRGPHVVMEWLSAAIQSQVHVAPPEIVSPATREQTIRWQRVPDVRAIEAWLGIAD